VTDESREAERVSPRGRSPSDASGSGHTASSEISATHRQYNAALTRLDLACQPPPDWPAPPGPLDVSQVGRINGSWQILASEEPPAAAGVRGRLAGFVWRLIAPALQKQQAFNGALVDHLNRNAGAQADAQRALAELVPRLREAFDGLARFESLLLQFLQQITPLVDARERAVQEAIAELRTVSALGQRAVAATRRDIERLAATTPVPSIAMSAAASPPVAPAGAGPASGAGDAYKYVAFEDQFRGSETEIRERLADYVPYFEGATDVLDIGCGRGELLDLLAARGIGARGLDLNPEMVDVCRSRGLNAVQADALGYLNGLPDESLGGLIAVQVVEHLDAGYLTAMLQAAFHKLRPGARVVLETINPACWVAFFESYIRDLTHVRPVHPQTLQYLLLASAFTRVEIVYRSPVADKLQSVAPAARPAGAAAPDAVAELVTAFNANVERLNARMFTYLDYAAVGVRP
jgi:O-antigen chain-terminating methyltransferase